MTKKEYLELRLWEFEEIYDKPYVYAIEQVRSEMRIKWRLFLEHGVEADRVVKLMDPVDLLCNFEEIKKYGAEIDLKSIVEKVDASEIEDHWCTIVENGIDRTELFEILSKKRDIDDDEIGYWLSKEIPASAIYEAIRDLFIYSGADVFYEALKKLVDNGLKDDEALWERIKHEDVMDCEDWVKLDIVEKPERWVKLGLDPKDYWEPYLHRYLEEILGNDTWPWPKTIPVVEAIGIISVGDIYNAEYLKKLGNLCIEACGDLKPLAKKLVEEKGYKDDTENLKYFTLLEMGEHEIIDPKEVARICGKGASTHRLFLQNVTKKRTRKVFGEFIPIKELKALDLA